jgi:putative membrane protein
MRHIILFGSLLALSACNSGELQTEAGFTETNTRITSSDQAGAGSVAATQESDATNPTDAASYVHKAGAADMWEIASSKAVLQNTKNADVKKFAQMMVDHHTRATQKLMASAKAGQISAGPPQMDAMQQSMLDDIKNAGAGDIDGIYLKHQRTAHNAALRLHQNFATNGTNDSLKKTAREMVGVVKSHIAELQRLSSISNSQSRQSMQETQGKQSIQRGQAN